MRRSPTASVPGKHQGKRCSKLAWISLYVLVFTTCNLYTASLGQSLKVCDYRQSTISCPAGFVLQIQTAFYGRRDNSTCSSIATALGFPPVSLSLTTCSFANVLAQAKTWCDGKSSCTIPPTGAWTSDPCVGIFKYTDIFYLCASTSGEAPLSLRTAQPAPAAACCWGQASRPARLDLLGQRVTDVISVLHCCCLTQIARSGSRGSDKVA
jgi:hypothetical protein